MFYHMLDIAHATHRELASLEFGFSIEYTADIYSVTLVIVFACYIMHGFH